MIRLSYNKIHLIRRAGSLQRRGFTLAEIMVALVISSMILLVFLGIHQHMQNSAASVLRHLDQSRLPDEIHQLITEDLDRHAVSGSRVRIEIKNKREKGMPVARLTITKNYYGKEDKEELFEEIVWQAAYDFDTDSLVLYRSHTGLVLEDRLLDQDREEVEALYPFVPVCSGLTAFRIEVLQGDNTLDTWAGASLPPGIRVVLSFAQPMETPGGELDVAPEDLITRVIAIDRIRLMRFEMEAPPVNDVAPINDVEL